MNLDRLAIVPRARSGWSAIDLAFPLVIGWWRALFLSWLIPATLVLLITSSIFYRYPTVALLLTWWLKPLYDRFPLYIMSLRLFGDNVSLSGALLNSKNILRLDVLPWLLWRRFSPLRSFTMPVTVLEQLQGDRRASRINALERASSNYALWHTVVCFHIESILIFSAGMMALWIYPEMAGLDFTSFLQGENLLEWHLYNIGTLFVMALVAPFYVGGGFTLYINRRIELEGWDIEMTFRNLAARKKVSHSVSSFSATALLVGGLIAGSVLVGDKAYALEEAPQQQEQEQSQLEQLAVEQTSIKQSPDAIAAKDEIKAIFSVEPFSKTETVRRLRWKFADDGQADEEIPQWIIDFLAWFENIWPKTDEGDYVNFSNMFAFALRAIVILILLAVAFTVYRRYGDVLRRAISGTSDSTGDSEPPPEALFGMAVTRESLPQDIPGEATQLWEREEYRAAVALLYRGALSQLIHREGLSFSESHTESECAGVVQQHGNSTLYLYFLELTEGWKQLAYGHQLPEAQWIETLCEQWPEVFAHD